MGMIRMMSVLWVGLALALMPAAAWSAAGVAGTITHLGGVLHVTHADGVHKLLSVRSDIYEGDMLRTEKDTYARIRFTDKTEVVLRPGTEFRVDSYRYSENAEEAKEDSFVVSLLRGGLRAVSGLIGKREPKKVKVKSVSATIGVRGTHWGAIECNNDCSDIQSASGNVPESGLYTDTAAGVTVVTNEYGEVEVPAGSFSFTPAGGSPRLVPPEQAIIVTMPVNISNNKSRSLGFGESKSNSCTVK